MEAQVASPPPEKKVPEVKLRIDAMSPQALEARRREIVTSAQGSYENLSTEALQELAYITSSLRRRNAGPPRAAKTSGPKPKPSIDDLL